MAGEKDVDDIVENGVSSFLEMSDDEISKVDIAAVSLQANEAAVDTEADPGTDLEEEDPAAAEAAVVDAGQEEEEDDADDKAAESAATGVDSGDAGDTDPKTEAEKPDGDEQAIDYKAAYEQLTAPFKANGKDITVTSVEDAISLMQMGANYNKKMAALKPSLKMLKLLENNGLLSEDKISYLIDLDKKNPEAISKLVKDAGIDPLDMSTEDAKDYVPKKHVVDDVELELDAVLDEIQDTPTYTRTLNVVSKEWDGPSKQYIANTPQLLKVINNHMQSGIYDLIQAEMENERVFGRLNGLSDIEAYRQVGDAIQARGGFDHLGHQGQQNTPPRVVTPKPRSVDDGKLKEKKRAASSTKPAAPSAVVAEFNPLALSDEEFSKQINGKYL